MKDLTKGSIWKKVLLFAIPVYLGNLFQSFYSLADTRIIGSISGKEALAAVGATSAVSSVLIGFLVGMGNGFAIQSARNFGAGKKEEMRKTAALSLAFSVIISGILVLGCLLGLDRILDILNIAPELRVNARAYIRIIIVGMIVTALYNSCAGILRAVGDSLSALLFLIFSSILNVGLDLLFVLVWNMGVQGAAYATVLAQICSVVLCLLYIIRKYPELRMKWPDFIPERKTVQKLFSGGLSMGVMMSLVYFGTFALQSAINQLSTDTVVAHTAARKLTEIFMMPFGVFGTTMATFISQNLGAGEIGRIKKGLFLSIAITWSWSVLMMIVSYTAAPTLILLITGMRSEKIIHTACRYLQFDTLFYFVPAMISIFRNSLQSLGARITPVFSSFIELVGKVLVAHYLTPVLGYTGVILAEPIVWVLMVIPLCVQLYRILFGKRNSISAQTK